MQARVRLSCSNRLTWIYTGHNMFLCHASPQWTASNGDEWTLVHFPVDFFSKIIQPNSSSWGKPRNKAYLYTDDISKKKCHFRPAIGGEDVHYRTLRDLSSSGGSGESQKHGPGISGSKSVSNLKSKQTNKRIHPAARQIFFLIPINATISQKCVDNSNDLLNKTPDFLTRRTIDTEHLCASWG